VLKYIDIPLQHVADDMLRRMGRRSNEAKTRELIASLRARIPGLTLRTTFIVGFPGEERRHFDALKDFVREVEFERLGVFRYSHEEGTPAHRMKDLVEPAAAEERRGELMELQQEIAFRHNRRRKGSEVEALVDAQDGRAWIARSAAEAPEIDPVIRVPDRRGELRRGAPDNDGPASGLRELAVIESPARFAPYRQLGLGRFVKLRITGSRGYDLLAEPIAG
jgi:ribosomal protein S12 methylthiotransferase